VLEAARQGRDAVWHQGGDTCDSNEAYFLDSHTIKKVYMKDLLNLKG
jgi:hypothetical protein